MKDLVIILCVLGVALLTPLLGIMLGRFVKFLSKDAGVNQPVSRKEPKP